MDTCIERPYTYPCLSFSSNDTNYSSIWRESDWPNIDRSRLRIPFWESWILPCSRPSSRHLLESIISRKKLTSGISGVKCKRRWGYCGRMHQLATYAIVLWKVRFVRNIGKFAFLLSNPFWPLHVSLIDWESTQELVTPNYQALTLPHQYIHIFHLYLYIPPLIKQARTSTQQPISIAFFCCPLW